MQDEYSKEAVFIPMQDFSATRVWNENQSELSEIFRNMTESIKRLPYRNMIGLLKQMRLFPDIGQKRDQSIITQKSEIVETISDRTPEDINKTIADISSAMKGKINERGPTKD